MKKIVIAIGLSLSMGQAFAAGAGSNSDSIMASVGLLSLSFMSTLESTNYYSKNQQDDAATYVATGGEIKGSALEKGIMEHRLAHPESRLSDMDIAQSILLAGTSQ